VFSSADGVFVDDFPQLESMLSFIVSDAPRHTEMRNIVGVAFTPRNVAEMADDVRGIVREIIDHVAPLGEGDLCELITKEVPGAGRRVVHGHHRPRANPAGDGRFRTVRVLERPCRAPLCQVDLVCQVVTCPVAGSGSD
jgi:hypothetical protein